MDFSGQHDVDVKSFDEPHAISRVFKFALLQKLRLKLKTARSNIEDWYLHFQIPERIRKHLTFYRLHFIYFLLMSVCGTIILYMAHRSNAGEKRFTLVDSIFNIVSVVTVTGLSSVRVADLSQFDHVLFMVLMTLGSPAFTSLIPLCVRRFYFYRHHRMHVKEHMKEVISSNSPKLETPRRSANPGPHEEDQRIWRNWDAISTFATAPRFSNKPLFITSPGHSMGNDGRETHQLTVDIVRAFDRPQSRTEGPEGNKNHVHSCGPQFRSGQEFTCSSPFNIMRTIEHKGLVVLSWMVPLYIFVTQLAAIGINLIFFAFSRYSIEVLKERNLNIVFFCVFTVMSAFTNSGIPANDDNLVPFQKEYALLVLYTSISLMGNLLYPAFLRLMISTLRYLASASRKPVYSYLLNHPRRCFTHLFPHKQTVWLGITVIGFTVFQLICFCALDWNKEALQGLNPIEKVVDGIYQSVSARNAGGDVVNIAQLAKGMLVLYVFMMFISSYPVALLRQNSTVYELTEIGIYDEQWEEDLTDNSLLFQSRKLFAKDSCYLCLILFVICIIEKSNIENDPLNFSVFNIIFEIVSAYGGVGMSVGYSCSLRLPQPNQELPPCEDVPYSLSGKWSASGKLILTIAMVMGRHRGLPHDIDSAIKLPHFHETSLASGGRTPRPQSRSRSFEPSPADSRRFDGDSLDQTSGSSGQRQSQLGFDDPSERRAEQARVREGRFRSESIQR